MNSHFWRQNNYPFFFKPDTSGGVTIIEFLVHAGSKSQWNFKKMRRSPPPSRAYLLLINYKSYFSNKFLHYLTGDKWEKFPLPLL